MTDKLTRLAAYWRSGASWKDVIRRFKGGRENHTRADLRAACQATGCRLDEIPEPAGKDLEARRLLARERWIEGWTYNRIMSAHKNDMTREDVRKMILDTGIRIDQMPKDCGRRKNQGHDVWQDHEVEHLKRLRANGVNYHQCGEALNRSESAVRAKCALLRRKAEDEALGLRKNEAATRTCLSCLQPFASQHRHNRICEACKGHEKFGGVATIATAGVRSNGSNRL